MNPEVVARSRAFAALGEIVERGVTPEARGWMRQVPGLAEVADADPDAVAAEHHRVLGIEVYPFGSVFLEAEGLAREPHAGRLIASRDLDALLPFLPPLVAAVRDQGRPWLSVVADLVEELVASEARSVDLVLPPAPDLRSEDVDLRRLATALVTPCHAGLFLSRGRIQHLSQRLELPCGFAPRRTMLANLFRAAARHDALGALLTLLEGVATEWRKGYAASALCTAPVWAERVEETRLALVDLRAAATGG